MKQFKFIGVEGHLVPKPGSAFLGQFPEYLGFERDESSGEYKPKAFAVDETDQIAQRYLKLARRDGSLAPADEYTAAFLGVAFAGGEKAKPSK